MNIFNLSEEYIQLMHEIEEADGVLTEELVKRLEVNETNVHEKLRSYRYIKLMLESDINMINDEVERLNSIKKSKLNAIDRIKENMLMATLLFGYDGKSGNKKLDYPDFKLYTVNKDVVAIEDESTFSNTDYIRYTIGDKLKDKDYKLVSEVVKLESVATTISKKELLDDLKAGVVVEGATIEKRPYLTIK